MARTRVLIVDDSVVVRRLVGQMLSDDPEVEVVGTASGGRTALDKLDQLSPDVVILDVEMPEMDGLETLVAIRRVRPRLPVVMFSRHTRRGAATTLQALSMGATDYVNKPDGMSGSSGFEEVRAALLTKVKGLGPWAGGSAPIAPHPGPPRSRLLRFPGVVLIGVSTGGPNALATLLGGLPADLPVPVLVVQHMPPLFTRLLTERLAAQCRLRVQEASNGQPAVPGVVSVCPGDYHLELVHPGGRATMRLHQGPPENSCRPSVDVLFRSAAAAVASLAVVLTGMGQDGLRGAERVRESGGVVLAQDEASSVVWGMPGAVTRAGLADGVYPIDEMAAQIAARTRFVRPPAGALGLSGVTEPSTQV